MSTVINNIDIDEKNKVIDISLILNLDTSSLVKDPIKGYHTQRILSEKITSAYDKLKRNRQIFNDTKLSTRLSQLGQLASLAVTFAGMATANPMITYAGVSSLLAEVPSFGGMMSGFAALDEEDIHRYVAMGKSPRLKLHDVSEYNFNNKELTNDQRKDMYSKVWENYAIHMGRSEYLKDLLSETPEISYMHLYDGDYPYPNPRYEELRKEILGAEQGAIDMLELIQPGLKEKRSEVFINGLKEIFKPLIIKSSELFTSSNEQNKKETYVDQQAKNKAESAWHPQMSAPTDANSAQNEQEWFPRMATDSAVKKSKTQLKELNSTVEASRDLFKEFSEMELQLPEPRGEEYYQLAMETWNKELEEEQKRREALAQSLTDDYLSNSEIFKEGQTAFEDFGKQLDETKKGIDEISTFEFPLDDAEIDASLARYKKKVEDEMGPSFGQQAAAFTRVFQDQMRSVFGDEATTMITNFTAMWAEQNGSWSEMWDENWAGMLSTGLLALDAIDGKQSKIVQGLAGGLGQLQALKAEAKMDWGNLFKQKGGEVTGIAISALGGMFGRDTQVGNALSGVGSGVAMGASFGPMGAFAGGVLGGLSSLMSFDSGPSPEEIAKEYAGKAGGRYGIDSALLEQVILKNSNNGKNAWEAMYHPETLQVILSQLKEFGEKTQKMFAEDIAHGINITWVDEQHTSSEDWAAIDNSCMHTQILGAA